MNTTQEALEAALARLNALPRVERPEREQTRSQREINEIMAEAHVPRRHRLTRVEHGGDWSEKLQACKDRLGSGTLIILCGARGRGKTQLAVELMRHLANDGRPSRYLTLHDLSVTLKATFDDRSQTEAGVISRLRRPRLLVMDEVGKVPITDWLHAPFFSVIDKRYADMRDTILISNHAQADLSEALGASVVRRANGTGGVIDASSWEARS